MVKTKDSEESKLGLVLPFTPYGKQNIISYMVGTYEDGVPKLSIYKFSSDSNILGPMQLDTQIEQDENIQDVAIKVSCRTIKLTYQLSDNIQVDTAKSLVENSLHTFDDAMGQSKEDGAAWSQLLNKTLIYVEPIYQQYINETNSVPILKKVIVASGNKLAIGNTLKEALNNLVSQYAVDIEIENTDNTDDLVKAIIKANANLKESTSNGDLEKMLRDCKN